MRDAQVSKTTASAPDTGHDTQHLVHNPKRLLVLEDDPNDFELLRRKLAAEWPDCQTIWAHAQPDFESALKQGGFDLILCDYCLRGLDGLEALRLGQQFLPEIPFIFVSGGIGDGVAVESLKSGATDYVLKDRLARLVPAIRRALKEKAERARRKAAEARMLQIQATLAQTNRDLMRRNEEIQNFYHTLSHELKTPLTAAREFISITMDGLAGPLNAKQAEYLTIARTSCDQLQVCVNDLLDATRLETGKLALNLRPASLSAVAREVLRVMERRAAEKNITLFFQVQPALPDMLLDIHRMNQVITNLMNNAIKFTPAGGRIRMKICDDAGQPRTIRLAISDTGPGIPLEEQEKIFDRLYQVKAGDATTDQGVGLGLYLCRELVRLHGGTVSVESEPGHGSTFSFALPRRIAVPIPAPTRAVLDSKTNYEPNVLGHDTESISQLVTLNHN